MRWWTALAVAGIMCLILAAFLLGGPAWSLIVAGVAAIVVAIDGSRPGGER